MICDDVHIAMSKWFHVWPVTDQYHNRRIILALLNIKAYIQPKEADKRVFPWDIEYNGAGDAKYAINTNF